MAMIPPNTDDILKSCLESAKTELSKNLTHQTILNNQGGPSIVGLVGAGLSNAAISNDIFTSNVTSNVTNTPNVAYKLPNLTYKTTSFTELVEYVCGPGYLETTFFHTLISVISGTKPYKFNSFGIAGGAIRDLFMGKNFSDIDFYMVNKFDAKIYADVLKNPQLFHNSIYKKFGYNVESSYAISAYYRYYNSIVKVQYVKEKPGGLKVLSGSAEQILDSFDFTCNQFILHGDNKITFSNYAMGDLLARRLRLINTENIHNTNSFKDRLFHFIDKGFSPDPFLRNLIHINI